MRRLALSVSAWLVAASVVIGGAGDSPRTIAGNLPLRSFALCPDGHTLVGWDGKQGWLIEWPSGTTRPADPATSSKQPPCAAVGFGVSPDGKSWAFPGEPGKVSVSDFPAGGISHWLSGHLGTVSAVSFSPDGKWLVSSGLDNDLRVWDARSWQPAAVITDLTHSAFALAWTAGGRELLAGGASQTVSAWQAGSWTRARTSPSLKMVVSALAVSHDGRQIAAGLFAADDNRRPGAIVMLDPATLQVRATIPTNGGVGGLEFSPDDKWLIGLTLGHPGLTAWSAEQ